MAEEKIVMTREGMEKLEKEYRHLLDVEKPEVIEQLVQARSQGDLSENADYDAARNRQAQIERRISEIEYTKDHAQVIEVKPGNKKINLGSLIDYADEKGETHQVRIVGTIEADPLAEIPSVSDQSALGRALIGHVAGDKVTVECDDRYEIIVVKVSVWDK